MQRIRKPGCYKRQNVLSGQFLTIHLLIWPMLEYSKKKIIYTLKSARKFLIWLTGQRVDLPERPLISICNFAMQCLTMRSHPVHLLVVPQPCKTLSIAVLQNRPCLAQLRSVQSPASHQQLREAAIYDQSVAGA